ncbi:MAG: hypothetical protein V4487_06510 [Chlamydiota bacterium]
MNILGLVFSLLLMLSFGFWTLREKQLGSNRLRSTYLGHERANREILNRCQVDFYGNLSREKSGEAADEEKPEKSTAAAAKKEKKTPAITLNGECAKINLWPLLEQGREQNPILYELTARLLSQFYGSALFENKARLEYQFLDTLLESAKLAQLKKVPLLLEKLELNHESLQKVYYRMLKGTKKCDLSQGVGYPCLLDYIKLEPVQQKICFSHAHLDLISVFFGFNVAGKIFAELHTQSKPPLTKDTIEEWCSQSHIQIDPLFFEMIELGRDRHGRGGKKTLIGEDLETHVSLRQKVYVEKESG